MLPPHAPDSQPGNNYAKVDRSHVHLIPILCQNVSHDGMMNESLTQKSNCPEIILRFSRFQRPRWAGDAERMPCQDT